MTHRQREIDLLQRIVAEACDEEHMLRGKIIVANASHVKSLRDELRAQKNQTQERRNFLLGRLNEAVDNLLRLQREAREAADERAAETASESVIENAQGDIRVALRVLGEDAKLPLAEVPAALTSYRAKVRENVLVKAS